MIWLYYWLEDQINLKVLISSYYYKNISQNLSEFYSKK